MWRSGNRSILELFREAAPPLDDREQFLASVLAFLRDRPELAEQWLLYSLDKRTSPSPYMSTRGGEAATIWEVGFYDAGDRDVAQHPDGVTACADFLYREAMWVLRRERTT
jgi:hypothetical protein